MSNGWEQTFTYVIPKVEGVQELRIYAGKEVSKKERTSLGNAAASRMTT
jgi:hypothetical protein